MACARGSRIAVLGSRTPAATVSAAHEWSAVSSRASPFCGEPVGAAVAHPADGDRGRRRGRPAPRRACTTARPARPRREPRPPRRRPRRPPPSSPPTSGAAGEQASSATAAAVCEASSGRRTVDTPSQTTAANVVADPSSGRRPSAIASSLRRCTWPRSLMPASRRGRPRRGRRRRRSAGAARAPHSSQKRSVTAGAGSRQMGQTSGHVGLMSRSGARRRSRGRPAHALLHVRGEPGRGAQGALQGEPQVALLPGVAQERRPVAVAAVARQQLDGRGEQRRAHLLGGARVEREARHAGRRRPQVGVADLGAGAARERRVDGRELRGDVPARGVGHGVERRDGGGAVARPQRRAGEPERGVGEARLDTVRGARSSGARARRRPRTPRRRRARASGRARRGRSSRRGRTRRRPRRGR